MKLDRSGKSALVAVAKSIGLSQEEIAAGLSAMTGTPPKTENSAVAVPQAYVCKMLSCSRHHVRKLEREGLLKPIQLAGLKRYSVANVMQLLGNGG